MARSYSEGGSSLRSETAYEEVTGEGGQSIMKHPKNEVITPRGSVLIRHSFTTIKHSEALLLSDEQ